MASRWTIARRVPTLLLTYSDHRKCILYERLFITAITTGEAVLWHQLASSYFRPFTRVFEFWQVHKALHTVRSSSVLYQRKGGGSKEFPATKTIVCTIPRPMPALGCSA